MNVNENKRLSNINEHQILFIFTLKTQLKAKAQALLIYGFYSDFLTALSCNLFPNNILLFK